MNTAKRLLVVTETVDDPRAEAFANRFSDCGFAVSRAAREASDLAQAVREVDAIVVDAESHNGGVAHLRAMADAMRQALRGQHRPVIAVADLEDEDTVTPDGIDEILQPPFDPVQVSTRVAALQRLSTMRDELYRRRQTAKDYGLDIPDPNAITHKQDAGILVVGSGPYFSRLEADMGQLGTVFGALSGATAHDYLLYRSFDLVVVEMPVWEAEDFLADLRRNARFHDLPVLMLADAVDAEYAPRLYACGVTDILPFDNHEVSFVTRADGLVREHRLREHLRQSYRAARHIATSDALTGLYSRGFLLDHLARVIADVENDHEPLSIAALRIDNIGAINADLGYPAGDRIIRQASDILINMVRGEDLAARWSGPIFVMVLTATRLEDAHAAMHRISAVIEASSFSLNGFDQTVSVMLSRSIGAYTPGDTAESLARRVVDQLITA